MANEEHLQILRQGVEVWNKWRVLNPGEIPDLAGAVLKDMNLAGINFSDAKLNDVNLSSTALWGADLNRAALRVAILSNASLNSAELVEADLSEAVLNHASLDTTNFTKANLPYAVFDHANLGGAILIGADLRNANLSHAFLRGAWLKEANLTESLIYNANLTSARMNSANLRGAQIISSIFNPTDLSQADFNEVSMRSNTFAGVDLRTIKALTSVLHQGPSEISINTIYQSEGQIPEIFLRECGVTEEFITQIPSLVAAVQPIQFNSCFISYSSKDEEFARRLHERMRAAGLRVWFAPEDIKGGEKLYEQIDRAIQIHDRLLLVLSEYSLKSEWVMTEIRRARKAEVKENRRKLFPIRLTDYDTLREWECFDSDYGKDLAVEVREYFIPDFSKWKNHDDFEHAFGRLLSALKASTR
jgi:uncharacterized protein YjbI with pentapeptide repeats